MRTPFILITILLLNSICTSVPILQIEDGRAKAAQYNVRWDSPSKDYNGSMPLGNGDIGLNAWVEESGDLVFYIGKTDSWDDYGRLLKVGRVRLSINPKPEQPLKAFLQTLNLPDGSITIRYGEQKAFTTLRLWVDANHPVIHIEIESTLITTPVASIELWRTASDTLRSIEVSDVLLDRTQKNQQHAPTIVAPDSLLRNLPDRIGWYHHNSKSIGPALGAEIQGVQGFNRPDPLLHRTFGALITCEKAKRVDDVALQSTSSKRHHFAIYVLTQHPSTPHKWLGAIEKQQRESERVGFNTLWKDHVQWWKKFWNRSWIIVTSSPKNDSSMESDGYTVSRAYALQRFITACAGRGQFPIKFNGSIFTVPFPGKPGDADYRQWGPGYWWQNTRLPYFSMCASGDFDLTEPLFRMYGKDLMPLFNYRTRAYFNHDGAYIPECIYFWGDVFSESYGWTPAQERTDKLQNSGWHKWEWVSGLELVYLMLEYYDHTLDGRFLREMVLPTARDILSFFDQHYATNEFGTLVMHPSQALETWWECTNPMPEVAGLHSVIERLLAMPDHLTTIKERSFWAELKKKLPGLPTRSVNDTVMLAPASLFAKKQNIENPELYAVFPFRLISFEKPNSSLGIEALKHRWDKGNSGWRQDDIFMAYLGFADSARNYLVSRARNTNKGSRFPTFWGPNYDWIPDQDHGSVLMKTLQSMLIQTDGNKIYLLPAWPKEWSADFKLHAPFNTLIEASVKQGTLVQLRVQPTNRKKDIVILPAQ
ncbi:MAG: DUF5703 domain-containing protein [bacterium]